MAIIRTADRLLNEPHKKLPKGMFRCFTRVIIAAALGAALAASGYTATASAAHQGDPGALHH